MSYGTDPSGDAPGDALGEIARAAAAVGSLASPAVVDASGVVVADVP